MTHVTNLPAILKSGALVATAVLQDRAARYTNIAYSSIQEKRAWTQVPCGPGGCLHDYVPFYFTKRSPMLYTISRGNVTCDGGQASIVHLVSTVERVIKAGRRYVFSDGHGIMAYSSFYDDIVHLGEVDWDVVRGAYWFDTQEDGDRKRRKQAEFLVHEGLSLDLLAGVVVMNADQGVQVRQLLEQAGLGCEVRVNRAWYY